MVEFTVYETVLLYHTSTTQCINLFVCSRSNIFFVDVPVLSSYIHVASLILFLLYLLRNVATSDIISSSNEKICEISSSSSIVF